MWLAIGSVATAYAATDCNQVMQIPVTECQSLLELYNSTNGSNWQDKLGWNETNTPCNWQGVTCITSGHVAKLNLFSFGGFAGKLTGELPDLNLPELQELDFSGNTLSGNIPNFSYLSKLQLLNLSGNNSFTGDIPDFTNLPNLQSLSLRSENDLSVNIPNFTNLPNLKMLLLDFRKLSNIPNFSNLPNLEQLYIQSLNYPSSPYSPDYFKTSTLTLPDFNLPKLTHLNIVNVNLTGNSIPNFSKLPNLVVLNLQNNNLVGNIPNFSNLPNLVTLDLAYNYLTGNIPNFSNVPKLGGLNLAANYLTGSVPDFSNLPNLLGINLAANFLSGALPNFTSFDLSKLNPLFSKIGANCGLTSYNKDQETFLNQAFNDWSNPLLTNLDVMRFATRPIDVTCSTLPICPLISINPSTFDLHIPNLSYNNLNLSANLRFVQRDKKVFFELVDYKINSALLGVIEHARDPTNYRTIAPSCSSANLSTDFKLHIPTATFGDIKLWADLQLHSVENDKILFELVKYGNTQ